MELSYTDLIAQHKQLLLGNSPDAQSRNQMFRNHLSTLVSYLSFNGKTTDSKIGAEMLSAFDERMRTYTEQLQLAPRTVLDRRSHLRAWRELVRNLTTTAHDAPNSHVANDGVSEFHRALRVAFAAQSEAPKAIARQAGASTSAVQRWLKGATPNQRAFPSLTRIEHALGLERNALRKLLTQRPAITDTPTRATTTIPYRARQKANTQDPYLLPESDLSPVLLEEWQDFFSYKTATNPRLNRRKRSTWRLLPKSKIAITLCSAAQRGNLGCVTAEMTFNMLRAYFGFLYKPRNEGGFGVPKSELTTLAWFAVPDAVNSYLEFRTNRSGGLIHWGQKGFASFVCSLTANNTGFLTQQPLLATRLPKKWVRDTFQSMCAETHNLASEWKGNATTKSRNPEEPIRGLLLLSEPLAPMFRAIKSLDEAAARAAPGSLNEALHKRDALLLSMLIANPLRLRNYVLMTYAEDGSGNLYRRHDGWRLRFEAADFKNEKGAAKSEYDAPLPPELSRRIEDYLEEFRPRLVRPSPGAQWVFPSRSATLWSDLSRQFERVTKRLIPETPGFGTQAVRHLVATDYLCKHPEDYPTVAILLHDRLETVIANYAHLRQDHSFGRWREHVQTIPKA
ncbi:site-specific integrase [Paraburkholderia caballeronis]|uniref:site-specific integrase n=1 Tax=Paraburkholderia caballeronis TaxID=416943 RepID=UPI001066B27A|nr:site-specific integrase [Paraburkholderia caballeronis]